MAFTVFFFFFSSHTPELEITRAHTESRGSRILPLASSNRVFDPLDEVIRWSLFGARPSWNGLIGLEGT